jgi:hypothetical protein
MVQIDLFARAKRHCSSRNFFGKSSRADRTRHSRFSFAEGDPSCKDMTSCRSTFEQSVEQLNFAEDDFDPAKRSSVAVENKAL